MKEKIKVLFVQRFMLHYRIDLLERINQKQNIDLTLIHGRGIKNSKFVNYEGPVNFKHIKLRTIQIHRKINHLVFCPSLFWHLIKQNPDIIIAEGESNMPNNLAIYCYSVLFHKKIVWWGLGLIPGYKETWFQRIYRPLMLLFLKRASAIIGYSEYSREYYSKYADIKKIVVAHNCLDNEKIDQEIIQYKEASGEFKKDLKLENKFVILFVGAFSRPKKIDKLIRSFQKIKVDYPECVLIIVGDGKLRPELESLVKSLDLAEVFFAGKIVEGVSKYFLSADLFVLPGLGGLSIHHAMIHGLPVISASADGTERDLIKDGVNGFLLKTDTVEELTAIIKKFLADKTLSRKFSIKSREMVDKFINISNMVKTFQDVCEL
jgi:glycosyltransferase involved in cell wall biosynthesis